MEQFLSSFYNKPSVTIAGVFPWGFHHSGMVQHPSPRAPAWSTESVRDVVHSKSPLWPHCRNQQIPGSNSNPSWATQRKHQVSHIYPWHGTSLKNLLLGPVIPCLPDFPKIKRNQHLSNLSQAEAVTGPKRFQTDLWNILFNKHLFFRDTFFLHSFQAHFADRQKVNLRPVFCESLTPAIRMNTIM